MERKVFKRKGFNEDSAETSTRKYSTAKRSRRASVSKDKEDSTKRKNEVEPVVEEELQTGETLWTTISPNELVFARWTDNKFYSGTIIQKGASQDDKWIIKFDDEDHPLGVLESDILPIGILGTGTNVLITKKRVAHIAEVLGHKMSVNPSTGTQSVKYAIKLKTSENPTWGFRNQFYFNSSSGNRLRGEYEDSLKRASADLLNKK